MARCNNDILLKKIGLEKLNQTQEVRFRVRRDLPDCRRVNTKNYVSSTDTAASYNKFQKPENQFECGRTGCVTTGTLSMAATKGATYFLNYDATEFAAGMLTFYVKVADADLPATLTVTIGSASNLSTADVYTVSATAAKKGADGYIPICVDLSRTPSSVVSTGWTPAQEGAYVSIVSNKAFGLSSITVYDGLEDFAVEDTVIISCLSSIGGTYDVETIEETCAKTRYNDAVTSLSFPVTGTQATPNYWKLNPMMAKGENTKGADDVTVKAVVESVTVDTETYGRVIIPDLKQDECGGVAVQVDGACDITDSTLELISAPVLVALDENQFQFAPGEGKSTNFFFNAALIGTTVLITYPREVEVEEFVANPDNLNDTHVSMIVPRKTSDGVKYYDIFDNVFITSFPATISSDTAEFAFTITVGRDDDGNFFRTQKVLA